MRTHDELVRVAEDLYASEITYVEWHSNCSVRGDAHLTPHRYAVEMVSFWGDPGLGEDALILDADERDIVINLIEAKAREESR